MQPVCTAGQALEQVARQRPLSERGERTHDDVLAGRRHRRARGLSGPRETFPGMAHGGLVAVPGALRMTLLPVGAGVAFEVVPGAAPIARVRRQPVAENGPVSRRRYSKIRLCCSSGIALPSL